MTEKELITCVEKYGIKYHIRENKEYSSSYFELVLISSKIIFYRWNFQEHYNLIVNDSACSYPKLDELIVERICVMLFTLGHGYE